MFLSYARVSTEEQARTQMLSEQQRKCRQAALQSGADPHLGIACYTDEGISASIPLGERPQGRRMLEDAAQGDTICATKLDRLFRSTTDALTTVEQLYKRGVQVIVLDMGSEPLNERGIGKLYLSLMSSIAEFERHRINERTEEGRRAKQRAGGCIGTPPYGWRKVGMGKESRLERDIEEQDVMAMMLRMRRGNQSTWRVARNLKKMGVMSRAGKPFQAIQVDRICLRAHRLERAAREVVSG